MGKLLALVAAASLLMSGQAVADERVPLIQADPLLTFPSNPRNVDWAQVARNRAAKAQARVQKQGKPPLTHAEREAVGTNGGNDTLAKAERITGFGTQKKVTVTGNLAPDKTIPTVPAFAETNDAIPLASDTGIPGSRPSLRTSGTIGDGPHGSAGDRTGDFDFYRLTGAAGTSVTFETSTPTGDLDTFLILWDDQGAIWSIADNTPGTTDARMTVQLMPGRTFFVQVGAAGAHAFRPTRRSRAPGRVSAPKGRTTCGSPAARATATSTTTRSTCARATCSAVRSAVRARGSRCTTRRAAR
ncbi:hypothetical protein FKR81_18670 [Lentzea tibetensis]|uniref:Peptidase C-terminal archaeal/bacterial domain-containing protein n=1 Tax=Lentzea tibetensis TaxID=2591470 RepID=A0A563ET16_9PSEU|nr:PPC domain-containing protein [Lentzea tibetensis]TWP50641.1 hypothetical protein FKR81_18670 [Lentzea tibetensis]